MTSQIKPNNIDGTFPIAGQDNSSQGFRDNFTNTKTNFQYAYDEITALQLNSIQVGVTNNLGGNTVIKNGQFIGSRLSINALGALSGNQTIDFSTGEYQTLTLAGSVVLSLTSFPSGQYASVKLAVTVPSTSYTLTFPSSVNQNLSTVAGVSGQVLTFTDVGTYVFELYSVDATSYGIVDLNRARNTVAGGSFNVNANIGGSSVSGITMTVSNVAGSAYGTVTANSFVQTGGGTVSFSNGNYTGNVTAGNLIANTAIYGTLGTANQSGITTVGVLNSLSVTGTANIGNVTVSNTTDFCGAIQETGIHFIANANNGGSTTIYGNVSVCLLQPNAVIASYSLTMPTSPVNGQIVRLAFANTITALTHSGGSNTLKGGFTTGNANVGGSWMFHTATSTWYKLN